jgi:hypothetical protein
VRELAIVAAAPPANAIAAKPVVRRSLFTRGIVAQAAREKRFFIERESLVLSG